MLLWLLFFIMPQSEPYYELYDNGRKALQEKRYHEAASYLEAAVSKKESSTKNAKTYGVQFIEYYPYIYLAQAYYHVKDMAKAKSNLEKAYRYGENDDVNNALAMELIDDLIKGHEAAPEVAPEPDFTPVFNLINDNKFEQAQTELKRLFEIHPGDLTLLLMDKVIKNLIKNQEDQRAAQEEANRRIQRLVRQARQEEETDKLSESLSHYLAVTILDGGNSEASQGIARLKQKMEAKGISEQEIQKTVEQAEIELQEKNQMVLQARRQTQRLEDQNADLQAQLKELQKVNTAANAKVKVKWNLIPSNSKPLTGRINAFILGDVGLELVKLLVNGDEVDQWPAEGRTSFYLPLMEDFQFADHRNELLLEVLDSNGLVHENPYPYNFPMPPEPITPTAKRISVLLVAALVLLVFFVRKRKSRQAFRNRFNPYIAGAPVLNERMFYGRKPLLKQILNTLHNNSIMIFGERRIGKTSFLHQLHAMLPEIDDPNFEFIPVFIDLQGVKESQFFWVLDHEITLMLETREFSFEVPREDLTARHFIQRLRKGINHLKATCEKVPKLVLLLDEVDVMNDFSEQTNQQLRSVFMKGFAKHLVAVMAGIHINTTWKSRGSPWYNFFEQLELRPFSHEQAVLLITSPVKGVYQYSKEAAELIIEFSKGKPYLIQKFCVNLIAHVLNENRRKITPKDVQYVFKEIKNEVLAAE